jgi:hypothetical protein
MSYALFGFFLTALRRLFGLAQPWSAAEKRKVYRVVEPGKPRFQLRKGEEGLSVFEASKVGPEDILPAFRPGSSVITLYVEGIEAFGLEVVNMPGDTSLPKLLQDNHSVICPSTGMTRKEFKQALKMLENTTRVLP